MNGTVKNLGLGTIAGLVSGTVAFLMLNLTLMDRFRGQGASAATIEGRVVRVEGWIADYEKNVRPLRDEFLRFMGELPAIRREMVDLREEMRRLSDRLDRIEKKQPAAFVASPP